MDLGALEGEGRKERPFQTCGPEEQSRLCGAVHYGLSFRCCSITRLKCRLAGIINFVIVLTGLDVSSGFCYLGDHTGKL